MKYFSVNLLTVFCKLGHFSRMEKSEQVRNDICNYKTWKGRKKLKSLALDQL
jgi:hypothetical protein